MKSIPYIINNSKRIMDLNVKHITIKLILKKNNKNFQEDLGLGRVFSLDTNITFHKRKK